MPIALQVVDFVAQVKAEQQAWFRKYGEGNQNLALMASDALDLLEPLDPALDHRLKQAIARKKVKSAEHWLQLHCTEYRLKSDWRDAKAWSYPGYDSLWQSLMQALDD